MRVVLTGPESSGKTTLARQLSDHFNWPLINEFSREYLKEIGKAYTFNDVESIGRGQLALEQNTLKTSPNIICDTDLTVIWVWMQVKYGEMAPWMEAQLMQTQNSLYLLCRPDLPWEPDPLRENPHDRPALFEKYEQLLKRLKVHYKVLEGHGEIRLKSALEFIAHNLSVGKSV